MHFPMYTNGSFNPSPGNGTPNQMHLPHLQHNHASSDAAPPPPQVQQGYMYPPPPPPASSQQFHSRLPPVSMLPPPPPLPPGAMPPAQAFPNPFHPLPSLPLSFPLKCLEPPGMPLPPPPPPSSSPLVADTACDKPEAVTHVCESLSLSGRALDFEGPIVEDVGSSKESSVHCDESSSPHEKAEHGSPLYTDPDIEMEDDITLPENENYPSQPLNCGSNQVPGASLSTERPPPQRFSAETNSIAGTAMNFQTKLPVSKSYAQVHQDIDDGSRQASSSPYSGRANIVPECGLGDMYDPFVDSFEPAYVKLDCVQEHEPVSDSYNVPKVSISSNRPLSMEENNQGFDKQALSESDMTARVSVSSNKPPDVEENTTENDIGAVISGDNDEFGENAENGREGYSHETATPNSHNESPKANNNVRESDSTRKKSQGDRKEKDSSRSMKLFKVTLTKFVKDLLKPSWRQRNMSKEAFKTIVKRAVDKVVNSMEGRRVPKSRAKIDKYIDTSQHKLTRLVMGYVDKFVKA